MTYLDTPSDGNIRIASELKLIAGDAQYVFALIKQQPWYNKEYRAV